MKIAHEMIILKTADLLLLGGKFWQEKGIMPSHILWHIECNGTTLPPDLRSQVRKAQPNDHGFPHKTLKSQSEYNHTGLQRSSGKVSYVVTSFQVYEK